MSGHSSPSAGSPVFSIGGRMVFERQRLLGMTDEERRWRAQYLKDQHLDPGEPRFSPEYYKDTTNIFRRWGKVPLDIVAKALTPILGEKRVPKWRFLTGRFIMMYFAACSLTYYFKYNTQDWTTQGRWFVMYSRAPMLPGHPDYPHFHQMEPYEYYDQGFSESPLSKRKTGK